MTTERAQDEKLAANRGKNLFSFRFLTKFSFYYFFIAIQLRLMTIFTVGRFLHA